MRGARQLKNYANLTIKRSVQASNSLSKLPSKSIAYWLLGMSGLVGGMVSIGGITRLTKSGLSMTDWSIQGSLPPITDEEWQKEFDRYKTFPEWQQRKKMTIDEFKFIFFWEWGHRMLGRGVGLAFALPFTYFSLRGMIPRTMLPRMGLLFSLGGAQGLVGWWMVKSGLEMDPAQLKEIRVSPYRLAAHLAMAFTTYSALLWTAMDVLNPQQLAKQTAFTFQQQVLNRLTSISTSSLSSPSPSPSSLNSLPSIIDWKSLRSLRSLSLFNALLVGTTAISGAFVAGNDAGRAYNSFPDMNGEWIPSEILDLKPLWRNFFENTATVQFDHRVLALSTLSSIGVMGYLGYNLKHNMYVSLPSQSRTALKATGAMVATQVNKITPLNSLSTTIPIILILCFSFLFFFWITSQYSVALGITTLLTYVPLELAVLHQAGSLALLSFSSWFAHSLRFVPHIDPNLSLPLNLSLTTDAAPTSMGGGSVGSVGGGVGSGGGVGIKPTTPLMSSPLPLTSSSPMASKMGAAGLGLGVGSGVFPLASKLAQNLLKNSH